jgi:DNA-binding GntR family transcriptional regulator
LNIRTNRSFGSAAQWLTEELRRAIVEMEILPGVKLSEQEIAQRYNVSRQPVREALIALARSHLIDIQPQRGSLVEKLSLARMRESRLLREAIEVAIVRQACENFAAEARAALDDNLEAQERAATRGDRREFQHADAAFHDLLAKGAGYPFAWETIRELKLHTDRICKLTLGDVETLQRLLGQHRAILAAIDGRDEPRAVAAMQAHLTEILRALPEIEAAHREWFA